MNKIKMLEIQNAPVFDLNKLEFLDKLGEGAFGKVRLVRKLKEANECSTDEDSNSDDAAKSKYGSFKAKRAPPKKDKENNLYAVKILSKHQLIKAKQVDHVFNEMVLQQQLKHPFIVNMEGIQQDSRSLYILMEYIEGGELFRLVQKHGRLEGSLARFYTAQIILCFEYLHGKQLVYRDLKPENVLINNTGYLKLSDFGFIKQLKPGERTYTLCGTPEYLAPEIILNKGHGKAVDWYTLGIFIYEMMVGRCPFMNEDPYEIFKMIISEKIRYPRNFDSNAKSIIRHLTDHDLSKRYGNLKFGSEDIKNHRFFSDVNFYSIVTQQVIPMYIPSENTQRRQNISKQPGVQVKLIPENRDNSYSPEVSANDDPFIHWF